MKSKSIQLKTRKNSSTGWTGALASEHPMLGGRTDALSVYLLWMKAEIKFSTGWTDGQKSKHRCNGSSLFQRACFGGLQLLFSTGWTDASESKHRCIERPMFQRACLDWSVKLFSTGWTDAPTEHAPVHWSKPGHCVRTPTATIWTQRDRLNRRPKTDTHRFFRCSRFFCSGLPTAM